MGEHGHLPNLAVRAIVEFWPGDLDGIRVEARRMPVWAEPGVEVRLTLVVGTRTLGYRLVFSEFDLRYYEQGQPTALRLMVVRAAGSIEHERAEGAFGAIVDDVVCPACGGPLTYVGESAAACMGSCRCTWDVERLRKSSVDGS